MIAVKNDTRPPPNTKVKIVWVNGFIASFLCKCITWVRVCKGQGAARRHQGGTPREGRSEGGECSILEEKNLSVWNFFSGRCGVFRQKKGKIFPFWTPFLLRYNYLDFFSWEYHEIKKNRPKNAPAQTFVVIASCDESLCRYIFRGFPLTFTPLAWKRGRAVSVDASVISVSFPELPYPFLSCTAYLAFCPANVGHRSEKQD